MIMAVKKVTPPASHEEIARCAYLIWKSEGEPDGRELDHWLEAELQLQVEGQLASDPIPDNRPDATLPPFPRWGGE